jgi:hypothetical protein
MTELRYRSYGVRLKPPQLRATPVYRVMDAILEYNAAEHMLRRNRITPEVVVREGSLIFYSKNFEMNVRDMSKCVGYWCCAQDKWLGGVSPYDGQCALKFYDALLALGGEANIEMKEKKAGGQTREYAILKRPEGTGRKEKLAGRLADAAFLLGWVKISNGVVRVAGDISDPNFFFDHTRRRGGNGDAFGMKMLMEDMRDARAKS